MPLLTLDNICLRFADKVILENASATIHKGNKIALIGRNGEGKSTLMKLLASEVSPDDGNMHIKNGTTITRLEQSPPIDDERKVFDIIAAGFGDSGLLLVNYQQALDNDNMTLAADIQTQIDSHNAWQYLPQINSYIERFQLEADKKLSELSGGWRRRVLLVAAIISKPSLLLLDEPTNHMDISAILELEKLLINYSGTLILISHDREFVRNIANKVFDIDRGFLSAFNCSYNDYVIRKDSLLNAENLANARFSKKLSQEEVWIRQGIKARRTRNEGRVRALEDMRKQQMKKRSKQGNIQLVSPDNHSKNISKIVFEVKKLNFTIDNKDLIKNFSTLILKGDKIGIIGGNGIGKSSLIKLLLGKLEQTSGSIRRAKTIDVAYFDQLREELDPKMTAMDFVSGGREYIEVGKKQIHIIGYLKSFLFTAKQAQAPIIMCSGGEKNRLLLAKVLSKPANLLVLDEPSNDLDVETLELLEEMLSNYAGTLLLISHDREFLNNIITSSFVFNGNGEIDIYAGGYNDYLMQKQDGKKEKTTKPIKNTKKKNNTTKKLNYKEQQLLENLPNKIENLEKEIIIIRDAIAQPKFYQQDIKTTEKTLKNLADFEAKLDVLYQQWGKLE